MTRIRFVAAVAALLALGSGCEALLSLFQPNTVRVTVFNDTSGTVDAEIFISEQQDIPRLLLLGVEAPLIRELGERIDVTVRAGRQHTIIRSCDDLQAVMVGDADLNIFAGLGPDASSGVLRDGEDFGCGDDIQIIFHDTAGVLGFDVDFIVVPRLIG